MKEYLVNYNDKKKIVLSIVSNSLCLPENYYDDSDTGFASSWPTYIKLFNLNYFREIGNNVETIVREKHQHIFDILVYGKRYNILKHEFNPGEIEPDWANYSLGVDRKNNSNIFRYYTCYDNNLYSINPIKYEFPRKGIYTFGFRTNNKLNIYNLVKVRFISPSNVNGNEDVEDLWLGPNNNRYLVVTINYNDSYKIITDGNILIYSTFIPAGDKFGVEISCNNGSVGISDSYFIYNDTNNISGYNSLGSVKMLSQNFLPTYIDSNINTIGDDYTNKYDILYNEIYSEISSYEVGLLMDKTNQPILLDLVPSGVDKKKNLFNANYVNSKIY